MGWYPGELLGLPRPDKRKVKKCFAIGALLGDALQEISERISRLQDRDFNPNIPKYMSEDIIRKDTAYICESTIWNELSKAGLEDCISSDEWKEAKSLMLKLKEEVENREYEEAKETLEEVYKVLGIWPPK